MKRKLLNGIILLTLFVLIISVANPIFAQGSPPLLLDDTGTPGNGNWEINLVASLEHSSDSEEWEAPLFDINYGLGERVQIKIEIPFITQYKEVGETESKFEGIELGVKYRFTGQDDEGLSSSCYPQLFLSFNNAGEEIFLPFQFHYQWKSYGLTAELGHAWTDGIDEGWEGGVGGALYLDNLEFLVEYHSKYNANGFNLVEPMIDVGVVWDWTEISSLMFAIGKSVKSTDEDTNLWTLAGIQFLL